MTTPKSAVYYVEMERDELAVRLIEAEFEVKRTKGVTARKLLEEYGDLADRYLTYADAALQYVRDVSETAHLSQ